MSKNIVVTIGRETGSGGLAIGKMLAERMGVKCYDKELLNLAAKQSGMCKELFETHDEKPNNSFLYSLVMDTYSVGYSASTYTELPINHKIFLAQFDTIKKLAEQESCVIVGRCADYALADNPNMISVFITAEPEDKIARLADFHGITKEKAKDLMVKSDKKKVNYYNYYSSKKWGDVKSYDLCINSSKIGYEGTVNMILQYMKEKANK